MTTGPENLTRWVKRRLEHELKANLPDLEDAARAGFKRLRAQVLDEVGAAVERGKAELVNPGGDAIEKAKDLVGKASSGVKDLFDKLPKFPKGRY